MVLSLWLFNKEKISEVGFMNQWGIPEYDKESGLKRLYELVGAMMEKEAVGITEVAGGSASGKTTEVAKKVHDLFGPRSGLLSLDDYFIGKKLMAARGVKHFDQPQALDMDLIYRHMTSLKNGEAIMKPVYSFKTGERSGTERFEPRPLIVAEGLYATIDELKDLGGVRVFVQIGTHGRVIRRVMRDIDRTNMLPNNILEYFSEVVQPMHEKWVEAQIKNAHLIINNEYQPDIEARRAGLFEVQLKFRTTISSEIIRRAGGERLGGFKQRDLYYNPFDRDLSFTGESVRIREEETGYLSFAYKGPKEKSNYRQRAKIEFEINEETKRKFLAIYGKEVKIIEKKRVLYQLLDGLVFSADTVWKIENGARTYLGDFIEVRATKKGATEPLIGEALKKLDLDPADGIKASYVEM
jgi:uridine kinase